MAEVVPRLQKHWSDGAWIGCVFRAVGETEKLHAHYVAAAWEPPDPGAAPMIARLPDATYFAPHDAERALIGLLDAFWESKGSDSTQYLDWAKAQRVVLPNLKPSTKTISLRLPQHLLDSIKAAANARDVPYQSLIKVWLQEKIEQH